MNNEVIEDISKYIGDRLNGIVPIEMTDGSHNILDATLEVMQDADELGGCDDSEDYCAFMLNMIADCNKRLTVCYNNMKE